MSDDIQRESERIHKGIIESLSFSEALAKRDEEIKRLREEKAALISAKAVTITPAPIPEGFVIDELRKTITALHVDIARIREAGRKDYEGMREFQRKFIDADHEIDRLRHLATQRGARMQLMREWMNFCPSGPTQNLWTDFVYDHPEAADWFDEDGVPR